MMIDIETTVFDNVATALETAFPGINVYPLLQEPAEFPTVTVEEVDNRIADRYIDTGRIENVASVSYEINVFTNDTSGAKTRAKKIAAVADEAMELMGFARSGYAVALATATGVRYVVRYRANVMRGGSVYPLT